MDDTDLLQLPMLRGGSHWTAAPTVERAEDGESATIYGVGAPTGVTGWFPSGPVRLAESCKFLVPQGRDQLGLVAHDEARCIARTGNDMLSLEARDDGLHYRMTVPLDTSDRRDAAAYVADGTWNAASIGFSIVESRMIEAPDNSPESTTGDKPIKQREASAIVVWEQSILPAGAFAGAEALTADAGRGEIAALLAEHPDLEARLEAGAWVVRRQWQIDGESVHRDTDDGAESEYTETVSMQTQTDYEEGDDDGDEAGADGDDDMEAAATADGPGREEAAGDGLSREGAETSSIDLRAATAAALTRQTRRVAP